MHHLGVANDPQLGPTNIRNWLIRRATGKFYTHTLIGTQLANALVFCAKRDWRALEAIKVVDPFCGDGRLIVWLLEEAHRIGLMTPRWSVQVWDIDKAATEIAHKKIAEAAKRLGINASISATVKDSFAGRLPRTGTFDLVLTNPPWDLLKPDTRELTRMSQRSRDQYVEALRQQDTFLAQRFPKSQPARKFAGWGTNLSRAGIELSTKLCRKGGIVAAVSPPSLFADENSEALREWLFSEMRLIEVAYFPAELKLFAGADVTASTMIFKRQQAKRYKAKITHFEPGPVSKSSPLYVSTTKLRRDGFAIPISMSPESVVGLQSLKTLSQFADLEDETPTALWAGRELDETRVGNRYQASGVPFAKGRSIARFSEPSCVAHVARSHLDRFKSARYERIAWRDVSRPSQRRRMQATLIPKNWVTGNSLHVAYFRDDDPERLRALLAIMNSVVFECQIRARLATGHLSLGVVRKARVPTLRKQALVRRLASLAQKCIRGNVAATNEIEVAVAKAYGVERDQFANLLGALPKVLTSERDALLARDIWR